MKIYYRETLDHMQCQHPGCDHTAHDGPMVLKAMCHLTAGTDVVYERETGTIKVYCHECKKPVGQIPIARERDHTADQSAKTDVTTQRTA